MEIRLISKFRVLLRQRLTPLDWGQSVSDSVRISNDYVSLDVSTITMGQRPDPGQSPVVVRFLLDFRSVDNKKEPIHALPLKFARGAVFLDPCLHTEFFCSRRAGSVRIPAKLRRRL